MNDLAGKKLLLLGGSKPYVKVAKAAKKLGVRVIVVDKNATEEILGLADEYIRLSLLDIDEIKEFCGEHHIDGVLNFCVDFAQRTYQEICEKFSLPGCYSKKQVDVLANKTLFKKMLADCGLETILTYSENDILEDKVRYPIIIKPSESSGSRGSTTCFDKKDALIGLKRAAGESRSGDVIIEEFIQGAQEVQITYFLKDSRVYVIRTADSYEGNKQDGLERVVACAISPSRYSDRYFAGTHASVLRMIEKLGLHDGPFFMQGFFHDGKFKFFDPGCRFPGVDFDSVYKLEFGVDIAEMMVRYALLGKMPETDIADDMYKLHGKMAAVLFPVMKCGKMSKINGLDAVENNPKVFSISKRHVIGDEITLSHDVNQRFGEIDIITDGFDDLKDQIRNIQKSLSILDENGNEMLYSHFDVERIIIN